MSYKAFTAFTDEELQLVTDNLGVALSIKRDSKHFDNEELSPLVSLYEDGMNYMFSRKRGKEKEREGLEKEYNIRVLFSVIDGRPITNLDEVKDFYAFWSGKDHDTDVSLIMIMESIGNHNKPKWYKKAMAFINNIKSYVGDDVGRISTFIDDFCPDKTFIVKPRDI